MAAIGHYLVLCRRTRFCQKQTKAPIKVALEKKRVWVAPRKIHSGHEMGELWPLPSTPFTAPNLITELEMAIAVGRLQVPTAEIYGYRFAIDG